MSKLTFGQKLMILRKNKKITQKELADKLGIAFTSMARYENNYRLPSAEILIKLSDFFSVSIDYFVKDIDKDIFSVQDKDLPDIMFKIDSLKDSDRSSIKKMILSFVEDKS